MSKKTEREVEVLLLRRRSCLVPRLNVLRFWELRMGALPVTDDVLVALTAYRRGSHRQSRARVGLRDDGTMDVGCKIYFYVYTYENILPNR